MFTLPQCAFAVAAFAHFSNAARLDTYKKDSALQVTLNAVENSIVKATVVNTGNEDLNLLKFGSLLDSAPVQKLNVYTVDTLVPFTGVLRSVQTTNLAPDNFVSIPAGSTFETNINAASLHDLSAGGSFTLVAEGAIPYALANSTELSGSAVAFKSNTLTLEVDGATAAAVPRALNSIDRRAAIQSGCSTSQRSATAVALTNCRSLSTAAAIAARSGSSTKFSEYFRTTSSSTRITVANRFTAVASECRSSSSGATYYYCTDVYGYCESNVLAYTIPATDEVINCPLYYSALPALTSTCHDQDRATTTLHEFTHAPGVYSPGTEDYAYGYAASTALSPSRAVFNADNYALFANAIYVGC